jgi:mono/diheme cytochrome c family protein
VLAKIRPPTIRQPRRKNPRLRLISTGTPLARTTATHKEVPVIRKIALLAVVVCMPCVAFAQTPAKTPVVKKGSAPMTKSSDGREQFDAYCAPCHGKAGKGDGPAAPALTPRPSDLTQFTKKHGKAGAFPGKDFEDTLNGMAMSPAHGSTDMPVWGPIFRQMGNDTLRFYNVRKYVESLQVQ